MVIILADDTMENDVFQVHEAPGLSFTGSPIDVGYIVFSKSRSGTVRVWKWWIVSVFIPFIVQCRELEAVTSAGILQAF